jgi:hypothetical protein
VFDLRRFFRKHLHIFGSDQYHNRSVDGHPSQAFRLK